MYRLKRLVKRGRDAAYCWVGRIAGTVGLDLLADPVFVVGTGRCGTSLLVKMLESHPGILVFPDEANHLWHPKLYSMRSHGPTVPPIEVDPAQFTATSVGSWPVGHARRIRHTFAGFQLTRGTTKTFVVKSAMVAFMLPTIRDIFPNARFIHIYRRGPAVVRSYFEKNYGRYSHHRMSQRDYLYCCAQYWNDCILEIERAKANMSLESEHHPFFEVSYEALCRTPKETLQQIAGYLHTDVSGFQFDLSRIVNRNYKICLTDGEADDLVKIMRPGLILKGYASG